MSKHFHFVFKMLEDTCPFCTATDTPVLHFWWRQPWVLKPGWTRLHAFLPARYSSDSPLVWHLPNTWQPPWQPRHFDPHTCCCQTYPQALVVSRWEPWLKPMAWAGARTHDLLCHSTAHLTTRPFRLGYIFILKSFAVHSFFSNSVGTCMVFESDRETVDWFGNLSRSMHDFPTNM